MMLGIKVQEPLALSRALMQRGFLALPAGITGFEALALTPPLTITKNQLNGFLDALTEISTDRVKVNGPVG